MCITTYTTSFLLQRLKKEEETANRPAKLGELVFNSFSLLLSFQAINQTIQRRL